MIKVEEYIIGQTTTMIIPEFNQFGKLCSIVLDGKDMYLVNCSPREIINRSLLEFGSDLNGAMKSSKIILGKISMPPIVICMMLDMYWFPSGSPDSNESVWFSLVHIDDYKPIDEKRTIIFLKNGHSIIVKININRFVPRYQRAIQLRYKLKEKATKKITFFYKSKKGIKFIKEQNSINYKVEKKDNEE